VDGVRRDLCGKDELNPRMSGDPSALAEKLRIDLPGKAVFRNSVDSKESNCEATLPSQPCRLKVKYHERDLGLGSSLAAGLIAASRLGENSATDRPVGMMGGNEDCEITDLVISFLPSALPLA
jgi:hypothetical protein